MILTGRDDARDRHTGAQIGVDEFAIKSPEMAQVKVQLRGLLRRARRAARARELELSPQPAGVSQSACCPLAAREGRGGERALQRDRAEHHRARVPARRRRAHVDDPAGSPPGPAEIEAPAVFFAGEERRRRFEAITALAQGGPDGAAAP